MARLTMRLSGAFCLATALGACTGQIGADNQRGEATGASSTSGPAPLDSGDGNGIDTDGDGVVVAYIFDRMNQVVEGPDNSSTMLYNSTIFISSDISDGDRHNSDDKPIIIGGRGGGFLKGGEHIAYPNDFRSVKEKQSNLLVTLLAAAGVASSLGDSDKEFLPELVA